MVSSEIRDFLKGLFYVSQPIGKLNFKLSIPVRKQKNKKNREVSCNYWNGRKLNVVSVILLDSSRHNISHRFV